MDKIKRYTCEGKDELGYAYSALRRVEEDGTCVDSTDYDALAAELAEHKAGMVQAFIDRFRLYEDRFKVLEAALSGCVEHMEWSTPQGRAAWGAARDLIGSAPSIPVAHSKSQQKRFEAMTAKEPDHG